MFSSKPSLSNALMYCSAVLVDVPDALATSQLHATLSLLRNSGRYDFLSSQVASKAVPDSHSVTALQGCGPGSIASSTSCSPARDNRASIVARERGHVLGAHKPLLQRVSIRNIILVKNRK